ncbi:MAG: NAD(P)H-dependent glycerol-3-phosphate dehydrogenase, partial [Alphaproteobacteria bacterium]
MKDLLAQGAPVGVLGAGSWGTALATVLARSGFAPLIWARRAALAQAINRDRVNADRLPGITLDPKICATDNLADLGQAPVILYAAPAQSLRPLLSALVVRRPAPVVVICAKGIERDSGRLPTQVVAEVMPSSRTAVLSGPSFAADVARGLPTAVTLAAADPDLAQALALAIGVRSFRPYSSGDPVGAQIGGAVKNVLAIACGIVEGRGLGLSARAALISRGFAEMTRLGVALGARPETLSGLSGLGDLVLTCTASLSRNMAYGLALGRGGGGGGYGGA